MQTLNKDIFIVDKIFKINKKLTKDEKMQLCKVHHSMLIRLQKIKGFIDFTLKNNKKISCQTYYASIISQIEDYNEYFWNLINIYTTSISTIDELSKKDDIYLNFILPIKEDNIIDIPCLNFFYSCIYNNYNPFQYDEFLKTNYHDILDIKINNDNLIAYARVISSINFFLNKIFEDEKIQMLKIITFHFKQIKNYLENNSEISSIINDYNKISQEVNFKIDEYQTNNKKLNLNKKI